MTPLLWWVDRAAGLVLLVLLTSAIVTGLRSTAPRRERGVPRFATLALHRNLALLALSLLALHVGTAVADSFVDIAWWQVWSPAGPATGRCGSARHARGRPAAGRRSHLAAAAPRGAPRLAGRAPVGLAGLAARRRPCAGPRHRPEAGAPWAVLPVCACLVAVALAAATRLALTRPAAVERAVGR